MPSRNLRRTQTWHVSLNAVCTRAHLTFQWPPGRFDHHPLLKVGNRVPKRPAGLVTALVTGVAGFNPGWHPTGSWLPCPRGGRVCAPHPLRVQSGARIRLVAAMATWLGRHLQQSWSELRGLLALNLGHSLFYKGAGVTKCEWIGRDACHQIQQYHWWNRIAFDLEHYRVIFTFQSFSCTLS